MPDFFGEAALAGWKNVVDAVHEAGGRIMPQIWNVGLIHAPPYDPDNLGPMRPEQLGPSGMAGAGGMMPFKSREPMTLAQIDAVIDAYATAGRSAFELGFDGVELHGAHGYLIDQFFWKHTNLRTDRFGGGSLRERAAFCAEIVAEIRRRTSPDFPIALRFSQWKLHDYGARLADTPAELEQLLTPLVDAGVDLFDCSQRRFWEPTFEGSDLNLAGWTKKITGKPSMTVGSVSLDVDFMTTLFEPDPAAPAGIDLLLEMLERGDFDLVGVGRALIVDPAWVEKVRKSRLDELKPYDYRALATLY